MTSVDYNVSAPPDPDGPSRGGAFFWPILILIVGTITSTGYQIGMMQDQLSSLNQAITQIDPKVKAAEHQKAKLFKLASDVLVLSSTDPTAKQIVNDYKIQQNAAPATAIPAGQ